MARTIKRQPFSVSTSSKDYPKEQVFNQAEFKGLSDIKNDVLVDSSTFADLKNVYVDENNLLVSRAPFKFSDNEGHIIKEWTFGDYAFRLQKIIGKWNETTSSYDPLSTLDEVNVDDQARFIYVLRCTSHGDDNNNITWKTNDTNEEQLKLNATQIEDKIFFWTNLKNDLNAFNTITLAFEDAQKYLYVPIKNLVSGDFRNSYEDDNYLTESYRERYLYSKLNYLNLDAEKKDTVFEVRISSNTSDETEYLYDFKTKGHSDNLRLMYPIINLTEASTDLINVEIVETPRATLIMKSRLEGDIQISFDGNFFYSIPLPVDVDVKKVVGYPTMSKDGLAIFVFGEKNLFVYKLVASETGDFSESSFKGRWERIPYLDDAKTSSGENVYVSEITVGDQDNLFEPKGYFETADNFTYVIRPANGILTSDGKHEGYTGPCLYSRWLMAGNSCTSYVSLAYPTNKNGNERAIFTAHDYCIDRAQLEYPNSGKTKSAIATIIVCSKFNYDGEDNSDESNGGVICVVSDNENVYRGPFVYRMSDNIELSDMIHDGNVYATAIREFTVGEHAIIMFTVITSNEEQCAVFASQWSVNIYSDITKQPDNVDVMYSNLPGTGYLLINKNSFTGKLEFLADSYLYRNGDIYEYPALKDKKVSRPLLLSTDSWYFADGKIWTTKLLDDVMLYLDKYINCNEKIAIYNGKMPIHHKTLSEHYFSFDDDNRHLLEVSSTRRDETDNRNFQIYLPRSNEQIFSQKITNLHQISDSIMGIFTEDDVWYMSRVDLDGVLGYTKAIRSKLPIGCRDGDDIRMAFDGQALILPTKRGFATMTPQTLLAETEQSLSYLSDPILDKYLHFYNDPVKNALATYAPQIKIEAYRYWLLFYKYMSREILVLDTRNSAWWILETQYPILQTSSSERLNVIMQIDYKESSKLLPAGGVSFIFADDESRAIFKNGEFPTLDDDDLSYTDDIIPDTLSGDVTEVFENKFVGSRKIFDLAKSNIDWHFVSQRLHFGQINNYKKIKSISLNLKGINTTDAKLSTKVFRDMYHPEHSDTLEIKVNDIRMFTKYLNLMHVMDFQYRLENDGSSIPSQFRLNSVGIKYEVKEKIR